MDRVSDIARRKKSGLYLLTFLMVSLSGGHNVSYFILLVKNEVPIYSLGVFGSNFIQGLAIYMNVENEGIGFAKSDCDHSS